MIRTSFTLPDRQRWTGGYQYFVNLFRALHYYGQGKVRPVVFVPDDVATESLSPLKEIAEVVRSSAFSTRNTGGRLIDAMLTGCDHRGERIYREKSIDVVFESAKYHGRRFPIPTIAWLPDFQHRLLPEIFGWRVWLRRELGFRAQIATAQLIMLSSESSRADCERLYPNSKGKIRVIPFAAELSPEASCFSIEDARHRYQLPPLFFYLPNQFWQHKNHLVIIEALGVLKRRGIRVTVAASGSDADHRRTGLTKRLKARVSELGLEDQFKFLGLIPREDVYALMRGAAALVNPSLFEGWSTTVEEAKTLNTPMVLSDIPVHREQAADRAIFFNPNSAESAAEALCNLADLSSVSESGLDLTSTLISNERRLQKYANSVEGLVEEVVERQ